MADQLSSINLNNATEIKKSPNPWWWLVKIFAIAYSVLLIQDGLIAGLPRLLRAVGQSDFYGQSQFFLSVFVATILSYLVIFWWLRFLKAKLKAQVVLDSKHLALTIGLYVLQFFALMLIILPLVGSWLDISPDELRQTREGDYSGGIWWPLFTVVIFLPIFEEVVFRGLFYAQLRRHLKFGICLLLSCLFFTAVHFDKNLTWQGNVYILTQVAVLSLYLTFIYEKTQNLWLAILFHQTQNLIGFYSMLLFSF